MSNINESIRDWVEHRKSLAFPDLADIEVVTMAETGDLDPPFLTIYETGASQYTQDAVTMDGVSNIDIVAELHTVPGSTSEGCTPTATALDWRVQFYDILGDRDAIAWITDLNGWRVFDIRLGSPITEPDDGRTLTRWEMSIVACPL